MHLCGWYPTRIATLLGVALLMLVPQQGLAATRSGVDGKPQAVLVLTGRSLLQHQLPAFMQVQPGRFVSARDVQRACITPQLKVDTLLLYLPDSKQCQLATAQDMVSMRQHLYKLSGRWTLGMPQGRLREQPFVAIAPAHVSSRLTRASCTCNTNTAPTGTVMCNAQTRTAATPIGPIVFLAEDVDGDTLTGTFSYQRDANQVQPGLPSSLSSSCVPGSGSLQCTVQGTAPAPAGIVQINLSVSDDSAMLPLDSLLEVLAPVEGRIFADGFELLGCR